MASRTPSRAGGGRSRSSSSRSSSRSGGNNQAMPLMLGGAAVVVVAVLFFAFRGGEKPAQAGSGQKPAAAAPKSDAAKPASGPVQLSGAKAGKTPTTPPPQLTQATLQELSDLLVRITALRNDAVQARTGSGDNKTARATMSQAKELLDEWKAKVEPSLRWQEEAQMEDWAQPAEYMTLESLYAKFQKLEKEVRMGGGS